MKSCPVCGRTFPDEYSFCLTDGTPLAGIESLSEEATVVIKRPAIKRYSGRRILVFVLAALLCLSLGATAAVLYFFWPRQSANGDQPIATASPTPTVDASTPKPQRTTPEPTPSPRERVADQTPVNRAEVGSPEPPIPLDVPDPGPTRISFRPGRVQQTVSGSVSDRRSFILSARAGQRLSANVTSAGDCVNFATGDATVGQTTHAGDNRLTILNSCGRPTRFTLTVSIR